MTFERFIWKVFAIAIGGTIAVVCGLLIIEKLA